VHVFPMLISSRHCCRNVDWLDIFGAKETPGNACCRCVNRGGQVGRRWDVAETREISRDLPLIACSQRGAFRWRVSIFSRPARLVCMSQPLSMSVHARAWLYRAILSNHASIHNKLTRRRHRQKPIKHVCLHCMWYSVSLKLYTPLGLFSTKLLGLITDKTVKHI